MARTEAFHWSRFDTDGPTAEDGNRLCPRPGHSSTRKPPTQHTKKTRWLSASLPPPPPSSALRSWPSPPPSAAPLGTFADIADAPGLLEILFFLRGRCDLGATERARTARTRRRDARATRFDSRAGHCHRRFPRSSDRPRRARAEATANRGGGYARGSSHLAVARGGGRIDIVRRARVASASSRASYVDPRASRGLAPSPPPHRPPSIRRAIPSRAPSASRSVCRESASRLVVDRLTFGSRLL